MTPDNKNRVLIVDALNAYLRAYIVDPSISANGQPIGGLKGFIKILQKLVRDTRPEEIVIVWDGPDGSRKRKTMDSNYKAGRKPIRLNRAFHNLTDDQEMQNKVWQQSRLIEYINEMPIIQVMLPQIEADDRSCLCDRQRGASGDVHAKDRAASVHRPLRPIAQ